MYTDEYDHLLGKIPDNKIAKLIGCSIGWVFQRRRKRGIPSCNPPITKHPDHDQVVALLGTIPDNQIAKRFNISRERVRQLRAKRGIPKVGA